MTIKPTVGRAVWYWPDPSDTKFSHHVDQDQPFAATIARVHSDTCINVGFLDANGVPHNRTSVPFVGGDQDQRPVSNFAEYPREERAEGSKLVEQLAPVTASSRDEAAIEAEIRRKGLNAPRLSPSMIDDQIAKEYFHVVPGTAMTICVLTLRNGFQVTGESAAASLENFDAEIGKKIARDNARAKIWSLEGYTLRNSLCGRALDRWR